MTGGVGDTLGLARYVIQIDVLGDAMVRDMGKYMSIVDILIEYCDRCWVNNCRFVDKMLMDTELTRRLMLTGKTSGYVRGIPYKVLLSEATTNLLNSH
jgi:hypothetical protein